MGRQPNQWLVEVIYNGSLNAEPVPKNTLQLRGPRVRWQFERSHRAAQRSIWRRCRGQACDGDKSLAGMLGESTHVRNGTVRSERSVELDGIQYGKPRAYVASALAFDSSQTRRASKKITLVWLRRSLPTVVSPAYRQWLQTLLTFAAQIEKAGAAGG